MLDELDEFDELDECDVVEDGEGSAPVDHTLWVDLDTEHSFFVAELGEDFALGADHHRVAGVGQVWIVAGAVG